jgi:alkylhydroperoxidase family enzyme
VLRYADAMTSTPVEVPEPVFQALRRHYDDAAIVELTSTIAWENYRARFDHALGIEAEGFSAGALCPLPATAAPH